MLLTKKKKKKKKKKLKHHAHYIYIYIYIYEAYEEVNDNGMGKQLIHLNYLMSFLLQKFDSIIFCCFVVALLLDGHAYYSYKYDFLHSIN
jgi:hypothetical protein